MSAITFSSAMGAETAGSIVTKTLDTFNNTSSSGTGGTSSTDGFAPTDKQTSPFAAGGRVANPAKHARNG